jgi:hypothetical protein
MGAGHRWLMPAILATWEAEIRKISLKPVWEIVLRPYLKNTQYKKGLVE